MDRNKLVVILTSIPSLMLVISIIVFVMNTKIAEGDPVITGIGSGIIKRGDTIEIKGKNFGEERGSSKVFVSSIDLISKYIVSWSEKSIKIIIPDKAESGLIIIRTPQGESEPFVVVVDNCLPYIGTGAYLPGLPFIEMIDPAEGYPGSLISITGDNFGSNKNNSSIMLASPFSIERDTVAGDTKLENFIVLPDEYVVSWENKLISFYLPDFIETGNIYIKTESDYSNPFYFECLLERCSVKVKNKKTYLINQSVSVNLEDGFDNAEINLWFPLPVESNYQRNRTTLFTSNNKSTEIIDDVNLYKINGNDLSKFTNIRQNSAIDVYERNFIMDPSEIIEPYNKKSPIFDAYTESTQSIPASNAKLKSTGSSITRRRKTGYLKARGIYDYILARLTYDSEIEMGPLESVIDSRKGDSRAYSLLFCALSRGSGIPARPVTGLFVYDDKVMVHWWAEFYIQGFGWFPVDPALADGMKEIELQENPVEYYWGNIDNQHIIFSRGIKNIPRFFPDGIIYNNRTYANQTHYIETDSQISTISADWSDIFITMIN